MNFFLRIRGGVFKRSFMSITSLHSKKYTSEILTFVAVDADRHGNLQIASREQSVMDCYLRNRRQVDSRALGLRH